MANPPSEECRGFLRDLVLGYRVVVYREYLFTTHAREEGLNPLPRRVLDEAEGGGWVRIGERGVEITHAGLRASRVVRTRGVPRVVNAARTKRRVMVSAAF